MHPFEKICEEYDISRYRLAQLAGLNEGSLNTAIRRNSDYREMRAKTIINLAKGLGISVDELLSKLES